MGVIKTLSQVGTSRTSVSCPPLITKAGLSHWSIWLQVWDSDRAVLKLLCKLGADLGETFLDGKKKCDIPGIISKLLD